MVFGVSDFEMESVLAGFLFRGHDSDPAHGIVPLEDVVTAQEKSFTLVVHYPQQLGSWKELKIL